jgi:hypothetical protein
VENLNEKKNAKLDAYCIINLIFSTKLKEERSQVARPELKKNERSPPAAAPPTPGVCLDLHPLPMQYKLLLLYYSTLDITQRMSSWHSFQQLSTGISDGSDVPVPLEHFAPPANPYSWSSLLYTYRGYRTTGPAHVF